MPQKHPPETTAVSLPGAAARAASCAGAGNAAAGLALALQAVAPSSEAKRIRAMRLEDAIFGSSSSVRNNRAVRCQIGVPGEEKVSALDWSVQLRPAQMSCGDPKFSLAFSPSVRQ